MGNGYGGYNFGITESIVKENNIKYSSAYFDIIDGLNHIYLCNIFILRYYFINNLRLYEYLVSKYNKEVNDVMDRVINNKEYRDKLYQNRYTPIYIKYNGGYKYDY